MSSTPSSPAIIPLQRRVKAGRQRPITGIRNRYRAAAISYPTPCEGRESSATSTPPAAATSSSQAMSRRKISGDDSASPPSPMDGLVTIPARTRCPSPSSASTIRRYMATSSRPALIDPEK